VDVVRKDLVSGVEGADGAFAGPGRLAAYAYLQTGNPAFAKVAAVSLFGGLHGMERGLYESRRVEGPDVLNPIDETIVSTNTAAQSGLTVIEVLAMCGNALPAQVPSRTKPDNADKPAQKP
jgi:hypothetical protein